MPDPSSWQVRRRRGIWRREALIRSGITTVVLDIGGVVIPSLFESVALPGFPSGPLADDPAYRPVMDGRMSEREYWADVAARNPDWDLGALYRDCNWVRTEMAGAIEVMLSRLPVVAFTNDMSYWFGEEWLIEFAVLQALDTVVEAAKLGLSKPDPKAFLRAAEIVGEEPARCLFVDDHPANLVGAERAGMATHLFDIRDPTGSVAGLLDRLGMPRTEPQRVFLPTGFQLAVATDSHGGCHDQSAAGAPA